MDNNWKSISINNYPFDVELNIVPSKGFSSKSSGIIIDKSTGVLVKQRVNIFGYTSKDEQQKP